MLKTLINNVIEVVRTKEAEELKKKSIENFIYLMLGNSTAGKKLALDAVKFAYQIPNLIFFNKMRKFLECSYGEIELEKRVKFSGKFLDDDYKKYVKRQVELINSINDENKIDYLANLTRAVILGFIDVNVYFKLAYIINQTTTEELEYLSENINRTIENNVYTFSLQQAGLIQQVVDIGRSGGVCYKYTSFATNLYKFALKFNEKDREYTYELDKIVTLENMSVSNN